MSGNTVTQYPDRYAIEPMTDLEVYKIGLEAIITLQPSTGYVSVSCPHHDELNGCHWWSARGDESLHTFLCSLNRSYAMDKLFCPNALNEFDLESSVASLKRDTIERRRAGELTSEEARDLWDQADCCENAENIADISDGHGNAYWEHIRYSPKPCAIWFWDSVWSAFIDHLRSIQGAQS